MVYIYSNENCQIATFKFSLNIFFGLFGKPTELDMHYYIRNYMFHCFLCIPITGKSLPHSKSSLKHNNANLQNYTNLAV